MKKLALATVLAMFAGTSAFAGNSAPMVADEPMMVEEDHGGSMGGSGGWVLPLVALIVIAAAVSAD